MIFDIKIKDTFHTFQLMFQISPITTSLHQQTIIAHKNPYWKQLPSLNTSTHHFLSFQFPQIISNSTRKAQLENQNALNI